MDSKLLTHRGDDSHQIDKTSSPTQYNPFKRPEDRRVKTLRFAAATVPEGLWEPRPPTDPVRSFATRSLLGNIEANTRSTSPLGQGVPVHGLNLKHRLETPFKMPHALSMPQSGFQALILCGPGIGLSTFTSVPSDYPKALVNVANRPMVWYVLDWCYRMGVTNIALVTPPASNAALSAALAQNPYLTSLPSPSPDIVSPPELDHTTATAKLLRLPEIQSRIKSDFFLLPCDLICDVPGETFIETYLVSLGGLGGAGTSTGFDLDASEPKISRFGGELSGRRGGLSIWYNTANREESVKGEACDFLCTSKLDPEHELSSSKPGADSDQPRGTLRKLIWTMPMSELLDKCEEEKSWKIRQSLLSRYGFIKCLTTFRDAHIYLFPYWVKEFASLNEHFESVSEDLVGTWAKTQWRKSEYRAKFGVGKIFDSTKDKPAIGRTAREISIDDEVDLLSLSSTQTTQHPSTNTVRTKQSAQLASRVKADPDDSILSPNDESAASESSNTTTPPIPPILSFIHPSAPIVPLIRRVDTTPLLLSVSLLLAKIPSLDESSSGKHSPITSPFAHQSKVAATADIASNVTVTRSDTLIDSNTSVASKCVIKSSVIGSGVTIGTGTRLTNCLVMDGAIIGERCVLTGTVIGKKANIGKGCTLQGCEVQDENALADGTEGKKGEKFLVGGLEDDDDDIEMEAGDEEGAGEGLGFS